MFVFILANKKLSWDTETLTSQASWLFKIRALNEILEWSNLIKKLAAVWAKLSYDALRGQLYFTRVAQSAVRLVSKGPWTKKYNNWKIQ